MCDWKFECDGDLEGVRGDGGLGADKQKWMGFFVSIIYLYSVINHMDRRLWTQEVIDIQIQEDDAITKLVYEYGNKKWTIIA